MELRNVLFTIFGQPVTLYALCLTVALAAGLVMLYLSQKREGLRADTAEIFALMAIPLGLIGARLFYCLCRLNLYREIGLGGALRLWEGGYAIWGAIGGAVLAAWLTAKITRQSPVKLLDAMAMPAALTIALCRFAEAFSGEGIGLEVENAVFQRFPFAVYDAEWEVWYWAIFMLEGLAALLMLPALRSRKARAIPGHRAKLLAIVYCSAQILMESLRRDNFLRWLFVRCSQLTAALVLGGLMLWALVRWAKLPKAQRMSGRRMLALWVVFLACVGVCIAMEFAVDKSADMPVWLCYTAMAVCCGGIGGSSYQVVIKGG